MTSFAFNVFLFLEVESEEIFLHLLVIFFKLYQILRDDWERYLYAFPCVNWFEISYLQHVSQFSTLQRSLKSFNIR